MLLMVERLERHFGMGGRRSANIDKIEILTAKESIHIVVNAQPDGFSGLLASRRGVHGGDHLDIFRGLIAWPMATFRDISKSDEGALQFRHECGTSLAMAASAPSIRDTPSSA